MDLFEDLVEKPKVREEPVAKVPRSEKPAGTFVDADAFNPTAATREDVERAVPLIEEKRADHTTISMTKDELSLLISQAIEASMSKFVKSLRTVLEDMGRRIESTTKGGQEVKIRLDSLEEVMNGHAQQSNSRFTSLDLAMKVRFISWACPTPSITHPSLFLSDRRSTGACSP